MLNASNTPYFRFTWEIPLQNVSHVNCRMVLDILMTIKHRTLYIANFLGTAKQQPGAKSFRTNIYFILRLIIG